MGKDKGEDATPDYKGKVIDPREFTPTTKKVIVLLSVTLCCKVRMRPVCLHRGKYCPFYSRGYSPRCSVHQ